MNKVTFALSIILSVGIGYFVGKNHINSDINSEEMMVFEGERSDLPHSNNAQSLECENNFQNGAEIITLNDSGSSKKISSEEANQLAQEQVDAVKAEYEYQQRAEQFTQWLAKNQQEKPWFDLGMEMRGRFDTEDTDHSWALTEESHLQSLFSQSPALAGIALKSTLCKSTQCQITVSVMDNDHANETAMAISRVLGSEGSAQIIIDNQAQQGESILYIARNEKGFEFN